MNDYRSARDWPVWSVKLSNGKTINVKAPSSHRAVGRVEKMIAERGSSVTVTGATEIND